MNLWSLRARRAVDEGAGSVRGLWAPTPVIALVIVTVANYAWQVPYFIHFYGKTGHAPGGLTVPLVLTFVWFAVGVALLVSRRRGAMPVLSSYLVVEAVFYLVHNLSGAFGRDLPTSDPILFIASVLGYVNAIAAIAFLIWLRRHKNLAPPVGGRPERAA